MFSSPPAGRFVQTHGTPLHRKRVSSDMLVWAVGANLAMTSVTSVHH
jgi:hypothetical protein